MSDDVRIFVCALIVAMLLAGGYVACQTERANQAHRAAGDRCLRYTVAYVKSGDVLWPVESCAEWAPRNRGDL